MNIEYDFGAGYRLVGPLANEIAKRGGMKALTPDQARMVRDFVGMKADGCYPFRFMYLYVFQQDDGLFKVGFSAHPMDRLRTIKVGNPHDAELAGAFAFWGWGVGDAERSAHQYLKAKGLHKRREWFRGNGSDHFESLAEICRKESAYMPLKDAVRKSMEWWPTYMAMLDDVNVKAAARRSKTQTVEVVKALGVDWRF